VLLQIRRHVRPDGVVRELIGRQPPRAAWCLLCTYPPSRYPFVDGLGRDAVFRGDLGGGQPLTPSLRAVGDMQLPGAGEPHGLQPDPHTESLDVRGGTEMADQQRGECLCMVLVLVCLLECLAKVVAPKEPCLIKDLHGVDDLVFVAAIEVQAPADAGENLGSKNPEQRRALLRPTRSDGFDAYQRRLRDGKTPLVSTPGPNTEMNLLHTEFERDTDLSPHEWERQWKAEEIEDTAENMRLTIRALTLNLAEQHKPADRQNTAADKPRETVHAP
jgi:hypothetical protein